MHPLHEAWRDLERRFEAACARSRGQAIVQLNQLLRRLRQYKSEKEWTRLVLEGAAMFAHRAALFSISGGKATLLGQNNLDLPESFSFSCTQALAFEAARLSVDGIIALRTPSEVTETLSDSDSASRAHLFPISNAMRVVAVLFAAAEPEDDAQGLELIAGLASCALERQSSTATHAQIALAPAAAPKASLPVWAGVEESQRPLHIRARRFARVAVAEMQLSKPEACRAGRQQNDLYLLLKNEIDKAREIYRRQFGTISPMADYLHLELVRTAAEGEEMKLGAEYPGQLV
ncbi:MAG TPA: hypothetical protein VH369_08540 [Bryobacteraceae bacterium]